MFGLHYPLWYALSTWAEKREHGSLPETGALNDQDSAWWRDMREIDNRYTLKLQELQPELDAKYEGGGGSGRRSRGGDDALEALFGDEGERENAQDWQTMFGD